MIKRYTWPISHGRDVIFEIIEWEGPDTEHTIANIAYITPGVSDLDVYQAVLDYHKLYFPDDPNIFKEAVARLKKPLQLYKTTVEVVIYSLTPYENIDHLIELPNCPNLATAVQSISSESIQDFEMVEDFKKLGIPLRSFPEVAKKYQEMPRIINLDEESW